MELLMVVGILAAWLAVAVAVGLLTAETIRLRDRAAPTSLPQRRHERLRRVV